MATTEQKKRDFDVLEQRRFEAIGLLGNGLNISQIARELQVSRQTVTRWMGQYRREGKASLRKAGRAGRKPLLSEGQLAELKSLLGRSPEEFGFPKQLWTCPLVVMLIEAEFGVRYHPGHAWKLLNKLGFSGQRSVGRTAQAKAAHA
jgi:transposase